MDAAARRPAATASMIVRGPGDDVAAGEDARPARGQGLRIGDDPGPAADLDAGALGEDRRIGLLADRDQDRARGQLPRLARPRPRRAAVGAGRLVRAQDVAAKGHDRRVPSDDLGRCQAVDDDDALTLGCLDLLVLGRHVATTSSIDDRDRRGAASSGRARRVHRRAATADDHHVARQARRLAEVDLLEEQRRRDDAAQLVARDAQAAALGRAGREEDRLEALALEVGQAEVAAHRRVQPQLDPDREDPRDLLLEHIARQPIFGDPDRHHAARHGHRLEHGHGVAEAGQVPGRGHAGGPATDDRHALRAPHRRRLDLGERAVLGRESLERPDRDRLVQHPAPAGALARRRADPAADGRERIDLGRDGVGLVVASGADQADVPPRVGAGGTRALARSDRGWVAHRRPSTSRPATAAVATACAT